MFLLVYLGSMWCLNWSCFRPPTSSQIWSGKSWTVALDVYIASESKGSKWKKTHYLFLSSPPLFLFTFSFWVNFSDTFMVCLNDRYPLTYENHGFIGSKALFGYIFSSATLVVFLPQSSVFRLFLQNLSKNGTFVNIKKW